MLLFRSSKQNKWKKKKNVKTQIIQNVITWLLEHISVNNKVCELHFLLKTFIITYVNSLPYVGEYTEIKQKSFMILLLVSLPYSINIRHTAF